MSSSTPRDDQPFQQHKAYARLYTDLADRYAANSEFNMAITHFDKALEYDRACVEARLGRALCLLKTGKPAKAIDDLNEAICISPPSSEAYRMRGLARLKLADFEAACADLTEAIRLNRHDPSLFRTRGAVRFRLGDLARAAADFSSALQLAPDDADAFFYRCVVKMKMGDVAGAFTDADRAELSAPHDRDVSLVRQGADPPRRRSHAAPQSDGLVATSISLRPQRVGPVPPPSSPAKPAPRRPGRALHRAILLASVILICLVGGLLVGAIAALAGHG